jgi:hypothetical protein
MREEEEEEKKKEKKKKCLDNSKLREDSLRMATTTK